MRTKWYALLLAAATGVGCQAIPTVPADWNEKKPPPAPKAEADDKPARPKFTVTADQVTETNAHDKARQLADELDAESPNGK